MITATNNNIFVEALDTNTETESGIITQLNERTPPCQGIVRYAQDLGLVDKEVLFETYAAKPITVSGKNFLVMKQSAIQAVFD